MRSLQALGMPISKRQLIGLAFSVIAGLVVARLLPYIYPLFSARLLDFILGPGVSSTRDGFNTFFMSTCTFGTSFIFSFLTILLFRKKRKAE